MNSIPLPEASARASAGRRLAVLGLTALLLAGCGTLAPDRGFDDVRRVVAERLDAPLTWARSDSERAAIREVVAARLAQPLDADGAAAVAVINHPGLQAAYADLGIAAADVAQAGQLPNPRFSTTRVRSDDSFKYETALTLPIVALLTAPATVRMERRRFEAVKLEVADRVIRHAAQTRRAWTEAVAAAAAVKYLEQVHGAAEATAELAGRMVVAGNVPRLDALREQAFAADTAVQLRRARGVATAAHLRLARWMGLGESASAVLLPAVLPPLPTTIDAVEGLEATALVRRLDILAAKRDAEATARSLGLTRATRFINALELGPATLLEQGHAAKKGYEISIELPIFDWGASRVARAESTYLRAVANVAHVALEARSEVREAHAAYAAAWDVARHYGDLVVPVSGRIVDESLLRYNGMLNSVFELLSDGREQVRASQGHLEALRDFWLAEADLRQALGGRLSVTTTTAAAPRVPATSASGTDTSPTAGHEHFQE
jgi:outer membrane protein TolC